MEQPAPHSGLASTHGGRRVAAAPRPAVPASPRPDARPAAAVLIGLDCITGLQTARILAARGIPVFGLAAQPRHFCCRTRAVRRVVQAHPDEAATLAALERLGPELHGRAVLVPCTDPAVFTVARHRDALSRRYHVPLAGLDVVHRLADKRAFHQLAAGLGLPVPRTIAIETAADADRAAAELTFPVILKPAVRSPQWDACSPAKVHHVHTAAGLRELVARARGWADALVAQEWIPGPDSELYSCNAFFNARSEPLVTFTARKIRQWPPGGGTSTLGEECGNEEVRGMTVRLFRAAGYHGLAYLEAKRDPRTGAHYLLEANVGRPTGRSAIAEAAGVELLLTMYCYAVGLPLPAPERRTQTFAGARWIFWRQDLRAAFHQWRGGSLTLQDWARSLRGRKAEAVLDWRDPLPFLLDLANLGGRLLTGRRRGSAADSAAGPDLASTPPGGAVSAARDRRDHRHGPDRHQPDA